MEEEEEEEAVDGPGLGEAFRSSECVFAALGDSGFLVDEYDFTAALVFSFNLGGGFGACGFGAGGGGFGDGGGGFGDGGFGAGGFGAGGFGACFIVFCGLGSMKSSSLLSF